MKKSDLFRQRHFFNILDRFDMRRGPLDLFVHLYFKNNRQLGSKDRAWIGEKIYTYFRWKNFIDSRASVSATEMDKKQAICNLLSEEIVPCTYEDPWIRVGFPRDLYEAFRRSHGNMTDALCLACNVQAPCTLRANALKITRDQLLVRLSSEGIEAVPDENAPYAMHLPRRINVFGIPAFAEGLFEMQDAGSQLVAGLVSLKDGQSFLDYCAGSGGKTLAIAPMLHNTGQIFVHDIRKEALLEAKKRLRRAGIQNAQLVMPEDAGKLSLMRGKMDWVLVDAPCTGTGTLRRNPDMKWKYSEEMLQDLCQKQRHIFAEAFQYLKKGGIIVYATCSLLDEENEDQAQFFETRYPELRRVRTFFSTPLNGRMDGFYAVSFVYQKQEV